MSVFKLDLQKGFPGLKENHQAKFDAPFLDTIEILSVLPLSRL